MLTDEALEDWRASPVTEYIVGILDDMMKSNREALMHELWTNGECDPELLGRVKSQEDLIENLKEASADDYRAWAELIRDQTSGIQGSGGAERDRTHH